MKTLILLALILSTTIAFAGTISYNYDKAGRLTEARFETGGYISYKLDAAGNIEQQDSAQTPEPGAGIWIVGLLGFWIVVKRMPGVCRV